MAVGNVRDLLSRFWSFVVSARQGWGRTGWQDFNVVAGTVGDGIPSSSERGIELAASRGTVGTELVRRSTSLKK
jgi:hypothetical protein